MNESTYKKWNTLLGWGVFLIALITYTLTLEPTVSYWDCGEYISTAVKLEVGHPPGAPLFQMLGAFFAMFTTDVTKIAYMVNFMSGLASAFTILFLFWSITAIGKRMMQRTQKELTPATFIAIFGAGLVGSLAYTFSDSFWFSAVEAEVYAMSSFLMALLFWLGIRWEAEINEPYGNKWLLLISFVIGLSFGVHILSLLVIPAIVLMYIFKKYTINTFIKFALANIVAVVALIFVFKMLFPFTLWYFSALELFFVNSIGMPFNSGTIIAGILLIAFFVIGIRYTHQKNLVNANMVLLSILFVMIGFSSWLMLPIRANANTTINENNPSSARELLAYYNREQYGDANVFYDKYYSYVFDQSVDAEQPMVDAKPKYEKDKKTGKYIIVNDYKNAKKNWSSVHKGIIPRMVNENPNVIENYKMIAGIPKNAKRRPTFWENIKFMVDYQFGYMYWRYLMWNFIGRQNDVQGHLDLENGNWLSGIKFIDEMRLGPQDNLPSDLKNNKGRNTYFFLPFLLGLIGFLYLLSKDKTDFYTLFLFFAFTGLAIIFYTNPKPFEPRERDYAVVGSFYIFAMWIGFGVLALVDFLKEYLPSKITAFAVTAVCLLAVPTLMAFENWDDHDRSNRYTAHMNAKVYLDSCDENGIMFTIGDNDTFPLWYLQEVENYRTDLKLVNTSLFNADWYIDQMKRKTYKAPPIPSQLTHDKYKWGTLELAVNASELFPQFKDSVMDISYFMKWIESNKDITYLDVDDDGKLDKIFPVSVIRIPVDKETVLKNGIVAQKDADKIVPYIDIKLPQILGKNNILMLDIIANNHWKQPIYFTGGASDDGEYIWMKDYLQLEGIVYKLVPIKSPGGANIFEMGRIDADTMYEKVKKWNWKSLSEDIYLDPETRKNMLSYRKSLERLASALIEEKKFDKAKEIIDMAVEKVPAMKFGHNSFLVPFIDLYYKIGEKEKGRKLYEKLKGMYQEYLLYYSQFDMRDIELVFSGIELSIRSYDQILRFIAPYEDKDYLEKERDTYIDYIRMYQFLMEEEDTNQSQGKS